MIDANTTVIDAVQKVTMGDLASGVQVIATIFFVVALVAFIGMMFSRPRF